MKSNLAAASSILAGLVLNREIIDRILRSDIMRESVIYQQILEEGEAKGREEGREEGKEQKARQIALKMLLEGFSIGEIARLTDLSPAMLEDLQRQSHES